MTRVRLTSKVGGFTLIEILISILILALGMLGLGILFPVIIREQRIGSDATTGIAIANSARTTLTTGKWGTALPNGGNRRSFTTGGPTQIHPARDYGADSATAWMWRVFRDTEINAKAPAAVIPFGLGKRYNSQSLAHTEFQPFGQGEWYVNVVNNNATLLNTPVGTAAIGLPDGFVDQGSSSAVAKPSYEILNAAGTATLDGKFAAHVNLPISQRLYPQDPNVQPQFVWDFAVQRKTDMIFNNAPDFDDLRAVIFVRRIDPRIHFTGSVTRLIDALPETNSNVAEQHVPVGEDINGQATFDGTNGNPGAPGVIYSTIKTCEVEFWYQPAAPAMNHPDRLYMPLAFAGTPPSAAQMNILWSQMKQPGQKLVDNLGNIYTVVGSGNEPGVNAQTFDGIAGGDYIRVDPPVPVGERQARGPLGYTDTGGRYPRDGSTIQRAIWQVCFTPQIPVSVNIVDILKGNGQ